MGVVLFLLPQKQKISSLTMKVMGLIALTLAVCLVSASAQPIFLIDPITAATFSTAGGLALPSASERRPPPRLCCSRPILQAENSRINSDQICFVTTLLPKKKKKKKKKK